MLKMYIGPVVIDKVEIDYSNCETVHEREDVDSKAVEFLKERNLKLIAAGFIPSYFVHIESTMGVEKVNA